MNDRFKFRYYDLNTMYNVKMLDIAENEVYITFDESNYGFSMFLIKKEDFNENKLMQCTGLKDKNGKQIYEGDIVRYYYKKSKTNPEKPQATENFIVKWCERGNWTLYTTDDKESLLLGITLKEIEVIGNIYENPELLDV